MGSDRGNHSWVLVGACLSIFLLLATLNLSAPWDNRHKGWGGGQLAGFAFQHLKHGFRDTMGGNLWNVGFMTEDGARYIYYYNHPPGLGILVACSMFILGESESSVRIVPILLNLLFIFFMYLFARKLWCRRVAVISIFVLVFDSHFFYIRDFVTTSVSVLVFIMASMYFYARWLEKESNRNLFLLISAIAFGSIFDWQIFFIIPPILLHYLLFVKKPVKSYRVFLVLPLSILFFIAQMSYILFIIHANELVTPGSPGENIMGRIRYRTMSSLSVAERISVYKRLGGVLKIQFMESSTPPIIIALLLFLGYYFNGLFQGGMRRESLLVFVFLSYFSWMLVFVNSYLVHRFFFFLFLPTIPVMTGVILGHFWEKRLFLGNHLSDRELKIIYILLIALFFSNYLGYNLNNFERIRQYDHDVTRFSKFLSETDEDVILSFKTHRDSHNIRYYLNNRQVVQASSWEDLSNITSRENKFKYYIVDIESTSERFRKHLNKNYGRIELGDITKGKKHSEIRAYVL